MNLHFQKRCVAIASAVLVLGCMTANAATEQLAIMPAAVPISTLPEVLQGSSATIAQLYQQALEQPVWQTALNGPHA